jgi:hypothetical protein
MKKTLLFTVLFLSCQSKMDYAPPISLDAEDPPKVNSSIRAVHESVLQSESGFVRFETTDALWLEGYVVSSDHAGNFYKELYLQDAPENPSRALRLLLDAQALYTTYPLGKKVYVKLNDLGAGRQNGIISLGTYQADGVARLPETQITHHLIRDTLSQQLIPLALAREDFHSNHYGKYIELSTVQFSKSELGKTYASEAFDRYDGARVLEYCDGYQTVFVRTSIYSGFKAQTVPSGAGTLKGILTRDYYDEQTVVQLNTPLSVDFEQARCDPFYGEHFETFRLGKIDEAGWLQWREAGSQDWEVYRDENSLGQSARIGSYRSGDETTISWLISPEWDLRSLSNPMLRFRTSVAFGDASHLQVFYTTRWDATTETPSAIDWQPISATLASRGTASEEWVDSGTIQLPSVSHLRLAFVYSGSGKTTSDGTYELDDLTIYSQD